MLKFVGAGFPHEPRRSFSRSLGYQNAQFDTKIAKTEGMEFAVYGSEVLTKFSVEYQQAYSRVIKEAAVC